MTGKHSSIHPTLRSDRATLPWKRRRRIEFSSWPPLTIDVRPVSTAMSTRGHPSPAVAGSLPRSDSPLSHPAVSDSLRKGRDEDVTEPRLS
jgi:hypothetical protein